MSGLLLRLLGFVGACLMACWRATLRFRVEGDPRPALRAAGRRYVYAILHAQQLSFILLSDDVPILAMVSASKDGEWLVALCRARRIVPVRGSTGTRGADKGGRAALAQMVDGVKAGLPALLAADGPRGPRNCVHRGVVDLARETDACIVVAGVFAPANRFVLKRTWDRTQLPRPFSTLTGRFRPPDRSPRLPGLRESPRPRRGRAAGAGARVRSGRGAPRRTDLATRPGSLGGGGACRIYMPAARWFSAL
jgi:lysophospholipid acyltransferase (LPLAT)-like uncharacterized protein